MTAGADRVRISACIIAMDEADRIGPCLESLAFCDEILVIDSGSTDGTQDLCRAAGARVIETDWPGWVAQKQRAVEAATHDWILSLDADERVDSALRDQIVALRDGSLANAEGPFAYEMTRRVFYLGRWIDHGGWYPEWRVRLFRRDHARWGGVDPHDHVQADGAVARIGTGNLEHFTYRSIQDHLKQMNRFTQVGAEQLYKRGKRRALPSMLFKPPWRFLHMYVLRRGFLDGKAGLIVAILHAYAGFLKYAKLWERVRKARRDADPDPERRAGSDT